MSRQGVYAGAALACIALACLFAPWLTTDPDRQRPWLGALPPMATALDLPANLRFAVGEPAPLAATATIALTTSGDPAGWPTWRVALRRGLVEIVGPDARMHERLDLRGAGMRLRNRDWSPGAPAPAIEVLAGTPPSAGLFVSGERVVYLAQPDDMVRQVTVTVAAGRVTAIDDGGTARALLEVPAVAVRAAAVDGREPRSRHLLGTDPLGRDLLARLLHGGRISLAVALVATLVALCIGVLYGAVAGWRGGRSDTAMMAAVDILYCVPFLLLVIVLMAVLGRSLWLFFLALGAVSWLTTARIVRAQVQVLAGTDWVLAARAAGIPPARLLLRQIIPAAAPAIAAAAVLTIPIVVMEESLLSFVGLGIQSPDGRAVDSWGTLISQGMAGLGPGGERAWLLIAPCAAMVATLLACGALGEALRRRAAGDGGR